MVSPSSPSPACADERPLARLSVPAELPYLPAVLSFVRHLAAQHGMDARTVERLAFVAEEACANIMANAYPPDEKGTVDLLLYQRPGRLVFALEDQGLPYDFRSFEQEEQSFLGELLRRAFAGEVHCLSRPRCGNRVELIHDLPAKATLAHVAEEEMARAAAEPPAPADAAITIRPMQPEDAEGLVRCTYRTFGYTYFDETFYDPDQVRRLMAGGRFHVIVAVNVAGEVIGHVSLTLERPGAVVAELTLAVVDPRYRGHHLFERMKGFAKQYAADHGWLGLYSEAVAAHPYSQKGNLSAGARETGVLLADMPPDVAFKKIKDVAQRQATVLFFVATRPMPERVAWTPPAHAAMVRRLYEHVGLPRAVKETGTAPDTADAPPQLDVKVDVGASEAYLLVTAGGKGLDQLVAARLRELCRRRVDVIYLDLPMSRPEVIGHVPAMEGLGFFFGGVVPELADGDVLRLQFLNEVTIDPSQLQLASDFGKELLEYVLRCRDAVAAR